MFTRASSDASPAARHPALVYPQPVHAFGSSVTQTFLSSSDGGGALAHHNAHRDRSPATSTAGQPYASSPKEDLVVTSADSDRHARGRPPSVHSAPDVDANVDRAADVTRSSMSSSQHSSSRSSSRRNSTNGSGNGIPPQMASTSSSSCVYSALTTNASATTASASFDFDDRHRPNHVVLSPQIRGLEDALAV